MVTPLQNSSLSRTTSEALLSDLVLDEEWKQKLELDVEACLHSMADEVKQKFNSMLARVHVTLQERKRLAAENVGIVKKFLPLAEKKLPVLPEWERQERWGVCSEQAESSWSGSMTKEQRAISDRMEREKKNKPLPALPLQPLKSEPEPVPRSIMPAPPSDRKPGHHELEEVLSSRTTREFRASCIASTDSWGASSIPNNSPLARPLPTGRVQMSGRHTITCEDMLHTFMLLRRGSTARTTSSLPSPVLSEAFSDLFSPLSGNMGLTGMRPESDTSFMAPPILSLVFSDSHHTQLNMDECASTHSAGQAWSSLCGSPRPKRKRDFAEYTHECAIKFRPYEGPSHSSQTRDDSWFWTQDMEYYFQEELKRERGNVESKHKEEELRKKEVEADRKVRESVQREEEAKKKEQEVEQKEKKAIKREMETRRREEEVMRKEQEVISREVEVRRKAEAARRKEEEVRMREAEARRSIRWRQEKTQRKEDEAWREISIRAEETRRREEDLREQEKKLRHREQDLSRREAEMRHRQEEESHHRRVEEGKNWFRWPKKTKEGP